MNPKSILFCLYVYKQNKMDFGFIIPTCCKSDIHYLQLLRCVSSIQQYHPDKSIILIDDSDISFHSKIRNFFKDNKQVIVETSLVQGSADQQTFKFLLNTNLFSQAIMIQDSMILNKKLDNIEQIDKIKFIWSFTNHRLHWDIIQEPQTDFNSKNNIKTHTDLVKHCLKTFYNNNQDFLKFALNRLEHKNLWIGCFGNLCIISRDSLIEMNNRINFVNTFVQFSDNRLRRANETIFSLICHYVFPEIDFEKSYDGLYYDGINVNEFANKECGFDNLVWCCKKNYLSKISFNR